MSDLDERTAYAIATWNRFDDAVPEELMQALCGAFAIVAAADGELSHVEVDDFLAAVRTKTDAFAGVNFSQLEVALQDLVEASFADPTEARRRALAHVAEVRSHPQWPDLVTAAAQIAVDADDRVRSSEEAIMGEIRAALGL